MLPPRQEAHLLHDLKWGGVFLLGVERFVRALPHHPEIDLEAIDLYLSLQYVPEPRTVYKDIYKLPAAHTLVWENGQAKVSRYWDYSYQPKLTGNEDDLAEELRVRLREAVKMRLISEVPLGAHLSGEIDSKHRRGTDGGVERRTGQNFFDRFSGRRIFRIAVSACGRTKIFH